MKCKSLKIYIYSCFRRKNDFTNIYIILENNLYFLKIILKDYLTETNYTKHDKIWKQIQKKSL